MFEWVLPIESAVPRKGIERRKIGGIVFRFSLYKICNGGWVMQERRILSC